MTLSCSLCLLLAFVATLNCYRAIGERQVSELTTHSGNTLQSATTRQQRAPRPTRLPSNRNQRQQQTSKQQQSKITAPTTLPSTTAHVASTIVADMSEFVLGEPIEVGMTVKRRSRGNKTHSALQQPPTPSTSALESAGSNRPVNPINRSASPGAAIPAGPGANPGGAGASPGALGEEHDYNDEHEGGGLAGVAADSQLGESQNVTDRRELWIDRQRNKQARLFMIQNLILQRLKIRRKPNITLSTLSKETLENMKMTFNRRLEETEEEDRLREDDDEDDHEVNTKEFRCFQPSCDLPPKTDNVWIDDRIFRLYFPLGLNNDDDDTISEFDDDEQTRVSSATLRLYKKPPTSQTTVRPIRRHRQEEIGEDDADEMEENLRVTVFQYTKPVKRNKKDKKDIVFTKTVPKKYGGWVRFDVKEVARSWHDKTKKNFGLQIEVEDAANSQLNPFEIFQSFNCSARDSRDPLLPFFDFTRNETDILNSTSPTLDVMLVSVARTPSLTRHARDVIGEDQSCFRKQFLVPLKDFQNGDEAITVNPNVIDIGYCSGTCPRTPNDARCMQTKRFDLPGESSCCQPTKLSKATILYSDPTNGLLRLQTLRDVRVEECGCSA